MESLGSCSLGDEEHEWFSFVWSSWVKIHPKTLALHSSVSTSTYHSHYQQIHRTSRQYPDASVMVLSLEDRKALRVKIIHTFVRGSIVFLGMASGIGDVIQERGISMSGRHRWMVVARDCRFPSHQNGIMSRWIPISSHTCFFFLSRSRTNEEWWIKP